MPGTLTTVRLDDLCLDLQSRSELQPHVVRQYVQRLESGAPLPPIHLYADGRTFWVLDGHHRVAACRAKGSVSIEAEVIYGTYEHLRDRLRDCAGCDCDPLALLREERRNERQRRERQRELRVLREEKMRERDAIVDAIT